MKNFKQIDRSNVWPCLQAGKKVYAAVLESVCLSEGLHDLTRNWSVYNINKLLIEDDVAFFEEIIDEEE